MPSLASPPSPVHHFSAGDLRLAYRLVGPASGTAAAAQPPVLFVHGLSYFSYDWVAFGERLCTDRPGCAMDMRGFGDSGFSPTQDYSVASMAGDIGALLDHLGWAQTVLVAHSMGGRSAALFAARHPERVRALVLVDWSPENAPAGSRRVATTVANMPECFASVEAVMRHFGADPDSPDGADRRARFEAYTRPAPGGVAIKRDPFFAAQFQRQLATGEKPKHGVDLWETVAQLQVPTLVLRGTRSDLFPEENLPRMLAANPRIRAQQIEAGHHIAGDNPAAMLAAIRPFIE